MRMIRFITLFILLLAVGCVRCDESQQLSKANKQKFLIDLLKQVSKLRNKKKSELSHATSLGRNHHAATKSISQDENQSHEHSNVPNKATTKVQGNISSDWKNPRQLLKTRRNEMLLDLLTTLRGIRSHESIKKTSVSLPSNTPALQKLSLLHNVSVFITSHSQPEEHSSAETTKFDERSSVIKPIQVLTKISPSRENKARYSFSLAHMSFLEELEKAQDEKLNKLSQLENEFSRILPENHNKVKVRPVIRVRPASEYSFREDSNKEETGIPLDKIQKPLSSFPGFESQWLKNQRPQQKNSDSKSESEQTFLRRGHMTTPWIQQRITSPGLSGKSPTSAIQRTGTAKNIFNAIVNKYIGTNNNIENKSEIVGHLERLLQKKLHDSSGSKTTSNIDNIHVKNEDNERQKFPSVDTPTVEKRIHLGNESAPLISHSYTDRSLGEKLYKNENKITAYSRKVTGDEKKDYQIPQYPITSKQHETQNNISVSVGRPIYSNKYYKNKNHELAATEYKTNNRVGAAQLHDFRQLSRNNEEKSPADYQITENKNKERIMEKSRSDELRKALGKPLNLPQRLHNQENPAYIRGNIKETQMLQSSVGLPQVSESKLQPLATDSYLKNPHENTGANQNVQQLRYFPIGLKQKTKIKRPDDAAVSHSAKYNLDNQPVIPRITNLHQNVNNNKIGPNGNCQNNCTDDVKVPPYSNTHGLGNQAKTGYPKVAGSSVRLSENHEKGIPQNHQLESPSSSMHKIQNNSSEYVVSPFDSHAVELGNQTRYSAAETGSVFPQSSSNLKNSTSAGKLTLALQKAQSIFLEKVKEIIAGHHKSEEIKNSNFGDSNKHDKAKQKSEENVINSSAYVMDESPAATVAPKKATNENSGLVPATPTNPEVPSAAGNTVSPPMQLPNLGFNAPQQTSGQSNLGFNSAVQSQAAGTPLTFTQQEQAHEEERVASQQERDFQTMANGGASALNGGNFPFQPSQSTGLNQLTSGMHYPSPNVGFRPPNVDDLDEYRGEMERYQLSPYVDELNHSYDDLDDDEDEDEDDSDDFDDGKKKSNIRKPNTRGLTKHLKAVFAKHKFIAAPIPKEKYVSVPRMMVKHTQIN